MTKLQCYVCFELCFSSVTSFASIFRWHSIEHNSKWLVFIASFQLKSLLHGTAQNMPNGDSKWCSFARIGRFEMKHLSAHIIVTLSSSAEISAPHSVLQPIFRLLGMCSTISSCKCDVQCEMFATFHQQLLQQKRRNMHYSIVDRVNECCFLRCGRFECWFERNFDTSYVQLIARISFRVVQ